MAKNANLHQLRNSHSTRVTGVKGNGPQGNQAKKKELSKKKEITQGGLTTRRPGGGGEYGDQETIPKKTKVLGKHRGFNRKNHGQGRQVKRKGWWEHGAVGLGILPEIMEEWNRLGDPQKETKKG